MFYFVFMFVLMLHPQATRPVQHGWGAGEKKDNE